MQKNEVNWGPAIFIVTYHVLLLLILPFYFYFATIKLSTVVAMLILYFISMLSITIGYHRYFSHRSYETNKYVEFVLLFISSMTAQGSALRWAHDHRLHHQFVDTDKDPYSIKKGFWYAHLLWMFEKKSLDHKIVADLTGNKLVMFQHKHASLLFVFTNVFVCGTIGLFLNDLLGAFMLLWWTRLFLLHHSTWCINSLAHMWGSQRYSKEFSAVDNFFLAILTSGEGYHNYHHTFAKDYRNGVKWYHYDPSKWLIWSLKKMGLVSNVWRVNKFMIKKKLVMEDKKLLMDRIKDNVYVKKGVLVEKVNNISERFSARISEIHEIIQNYKISKRNKESKSRLKNLKLQIKNRKKLIRKDWRSWNRLSKQILRLKPALN
tara:strand:- start:1804 stop:2931 length:1128 start_codon:yes stop_codon:yes gene_type:complete